MTRSEMIARLVFAMGGRAAEELVFREPTTGAVSDIEQATKIARAMVTEYGMSSKLGAVRYGTEHGDPFLGRTMGTQADYSPRGRARSSTTRCASSSRPRTPRRGRSSPSTATCSTSWPASCWRRRPCTAPSCRRSSPTSKKRPRLTMFDDFGGRIPSDKPPIKTPGELAIERGEPWPKPVPEPAFKAAIAAAPARPRRPRLQQNGTQRRQRFSTAARRRANGPRNPTTAPRPAGTPRAGHRSSRQPARQPQGYWYPPPPPTQPPPHWPPPARSTGSALPAVSAVSAARRTRTGGSARPPTRTGRQDPSRPNPPTHG